MNIWEILGISPTADIVRIKKAYADRAKEWHPEEHPEEFKRLRGAYQEALKQAKGHGAQISWEAAKPQTAEKAETDIRSQAAKDVGEPETPETQFSYEDVSSFCRKELEEQFFED